MTSKIHVGDVGTAIRLRLLESGSGVTPVDLSTATELELIFEKPGTTCVSDSASLVTDGKDGLIQLITTPDFLDEAGLWRVQAHITMPAGEWHSSVTTFPVVCNLCTVAE